MSSVLRPNIFATGATDDAAAAGQIFPMAGLYQSTVDEIDTGDTGRIRVSSRRALINAPDWGTVVAFNAGGTDGATNGTIRSTGMVSFSLSADVLLRARERSIFIKNGLDQNITVQVGVGSVNAVVQAAIYKATVNAGAVSVLLPHAAGTGGLTVQVAALASPWGAGIGYIAVYAAGIPTSGSVAIDVVWRS